MKECFKMLNQLCRKMKYIYIYIHNTKKVSKNNNNNNLNGKKTSDMTRKCGGVRMIASGWSR